MARAIGELAGAGEVLDGGTTIVHHAKGGGEAGGVESMLHEEAIGFVVFDVENNGVSFRHALGKYIGSGWLTSTRRRPGGPGGPGVETHERVQSRSAERSSIQKRVPLPSSD